jgi:hypothetical protein
MQRMPLIALSAIVMLLNTEPVSAQSRAEIHPMLTSKYNLSAGFFWPDKTFKIGVDGVARPPGEEINFSEALKLGDSQSTYALNFQWRFGEKWSVSGQYWTADASNKYTLTEDIAWEDVVFQEGTFAKGGVELSVARVFIGRKFSSKPDKDFGVGAGLHWLEAGAFIEGQILVNDYDSEFQRASVDADFPLPNIGAWYQQSLSSKWLIITRVDWLHASIGDYSGGLWNAQLAVNWAANQHFGVGLSYNYFRLDVDIDKSDWRGSADLTQHGPVLSLSTHW